MYFETNNSKQVSEMLEDRIMNYNGYFVSNITKKKLEGKTNILLKNKYSVLLGGASIEWYWGILHISFLYVDEDYRSKGVGKLIIEKIIEKSEELNCSIILLETYSFQAPTFYKKFGFVIFAEINDITEKGVSLFYMKRDKNSLCN